MLYSAQSRAILKLCLIDILIGMITVTLRTAVVFVFKDDSVSDVVYLMTVMIGKELVISTVSNGKNKIIRLPREN